MPASRCRGRDGQFIRNSEMYIAEIIVLQRRRWNVSTCLYLTSTKRSVVGGKLGVTLQGHVKRQSTDDTWGQDVLRQGQSGFPNGDTVCLDHKEWREWGFSHGASCKTWQKSFGHEDLPPAEGLADERINFANNKWAYHEKAIVRAEIVWKWFRTIVVVLLQNYVRQWVVTKREQ